MRGIREAGHSLLNDKSLSSFSLFFLTEPWANINTKTPYSASLTHSFWQPLFSSIIQDRTYHNKGCFRSMIWAHKSLHKRQILLLNADIMAVLFKLGKRTILAFSIYIPCSIKCQLFKFCCSACVFSLGPSLSLPQCPLFCCLKCLRSQFQLRLREEN